MDQEKIGKLIKEIRQKNNLTQKQFADKYGITYQAVSKWENGKNMPDVSLLKQISKDFKVNIEDLLEGNISPKKKKHTFMYKLHGTLGEVYINKSLVTNEQIEALRKNSKYLSDINSLSIKVFGDYGKNISDSITSNAERLSDDLDEIFFQGNVKRR